MRKPVLLPLALACALTLAGCGAPAASAPPEPSVPTEIVQPAASGAVRPTPDTPYPQRRSQEDIQAVYQEVLKGIGCWREPSYSSVWEPPAYPPEWAGAYLEEFQDNLYLHVNLAGLTPELEERYRGYVTRPEALAFSDAAFSYQELFDLQQELAKMGLEDWSSIGVNEEDNCLDVGVVRFTDRLQEALDALAERHPDLPLGEMLVFRREGPVTAS